MPLAEADRSARSPRANPVTLRRGRPRLDRRHRRHRRRSATPRIDRMVPVVARHPQVRAVMRERQRELGGEGRRRDRGPRHRHRRRAGRRGQGLPRRRRGRARPPSRRRAARDRRRRARHRPHGCATRATRRRWSRPRTPSGSTRPASTSTTSSPGSRSSSERARAPDGVNVRRPRLGRSRLLTIGAARPRVRRAGRGYGAERIPLHGRLSCSRSTTSRGSTCRSSAPLSPAHDPLRREGRGAPRAGARAADPRPSARSRCAAASPTARRCG